MEQTNEETGFERELKELKVSRENDVEYKKIWRGLLDRFEEKHKGMLISMTENQAAIIMLEKSIKTKAIDGYNSDKSKDKARGFGVGIREITEVLFDDDLALNWAKQTGLALKLDISGFKKIAKTQKIDFVTIKDKPIAIIPSNIKLN